MISHVSYRTQGLEVMYMKKHINVKTKTKTNVLEAGDPILVGPMCLTLTWNFASHYIHLLHSPNGPTES